jgi:ribose 1,5-bisphosphokinase
MERDGAFALSWRARGQAYGLPAAIPGDLAAGRSVVVNVSRAVIDDARRLLQPVRVIVVEAPRPELAARLVARGRESAAAVLARLARAGAYRVEGRDVVRLVNDGALEDAVVQMVAVLRRESAGTG